MESRENKERYLRTGEKAKYGRNGPSPTPPPQALVRQQTGRERPDTKGRKENER